MPLLITVGAANKKPVAIEDRVVIHEVINVTLTLDHRYTDGAKAMSLYNKFCEFLDDPEAAVAKYAQA